MADVRLDHVTKCYGRLEAVKDLSVHVRQGQFFFILGPSGAGKTSVLKMIAGLEDVTKGSIFIGDRLVNDLEPGDRDVAVAFENYALYPHLNVFDNIAFPLRAPIRAKQFTPAEVKRLVNEVAELLQIGELLDRAPTQLSGGQKQRVALGRTLIRRPEVFLLDEPIAHLDAKLRYQMRGELKRIQHDFGTTSIYTTPDQGEALAMADTIAVIRAGELQQIGTPGQIFNQPANEFVASFVGDPPMSFLECEATTADGKPAIRVGGAVFPANGSLSAKLGRAAGSSFRLGVRPGDIDLARTRDAGHPIAAEVYVSEAVGRTSQLTLTTDSGRVRVKAPADFHVEIGDRLCLGFDTARAHLFATDTGLAI